jgi:Ca-activated chloride channel family protein
VPKSVGRSSEETARQFRRLEEDVKRAVSQTAFSLFFVILNFILCLVLLSAPRLAANQESAARREIPAEGDTKPKPKSVKADGQGMPIAVSPSLHIDVNLALVNVTVTDPYNRMVTGLDPDDFRIFEDKIEQEVVTFSSEDTPISLGVILDCSGSMKNKISEARNAAVEFLRTANPQDEFFLVSFNGHAELTTTFTNSVDDLQGRMMSTSPKGATALLDAIYLGLSQMRGARNARRALLILSDGGDNHSRYSQSVIKRLVKEADTQIYAIGIFDPFENRSRTPEELMGPFLLGEITEMTGGRVFALGNLNDLPYIAKSLSTELRNQYILGYRPSNKGHDGRWRKIKIKLRAPQGLPPLNVYSKSGYYAPSH